MSDTEQIEYVVLTVHPVPGAPGRHVEVRVSAVDWYVGDDGVLMFIDERLSEQTEENGALAVAAFAAGQWVVVTEAKGTAKEDVRTMVYPRDAALHALGAIFSQNDPRDAAPKVLDWIAANCPMEFR